jgi:hypothetical protein
MREGGNTMAYKFCPECGARNEADTKFCTECGKRFPDIAGPAAVSAAGYETPTPSVIQTAEVGATKKKKIGLSLILAVLAILLAAAALLFFTGRFDRMMAAGRAGAGDYAGALESYEKYLSRSGDESTEALTKAALYALSAEDPDKALMYARSVPEKSTEADRLAGMASTVLAGNAMKNAQWEDAIEYLRGIETDEARELADECRFHLAERAAAKEDYEAAIALLEGNDCPKAPELLAEVYYRYGVMLMEEEKWEEAAAQFDKTSYADSDDLRGQCYYQLSSDYLFLESVKEANYVLMNAEKAADGLEEALSILRPTDLYSFHDSELAFFAEEYIRAMEDELAARNEYRESDTMYAHEYEERLYASYAMQSECLETINDLYPFPDEIWEELYEYNEPSEKWNRIVSLIPQLAKDIDAIESSTYLSETEQYIDLPNNTGYTLTVTLYFSFFDEDGRYISDYSKEDIVMAAKTDTRVVFEVPAETDTWDCDFWISDAAS